MAIEAENEALHAEVAQLEREVWERDARIENDQRRLRATVGDLEQQLQAMAVGYEQVERASEASMRENEELRAQLAREREMRRRQVNLEAKIGYIGSPGNLNDPQVKRTICELISGIVSRGAKICVGPPNAELKAEAPYSIIIEDMQKADVEMFNVIIITPGGPGAEAEAKRFKGHARIYNLKNSSSEQGCPAWFSELLAEATFDLNGMQVDRVTEAIIGKTCTAQASSSEDIHAKLEQEAECARRQLRKANDERDDLLELLGRVATACPEVVAPLVTPLGKSLVDFTLETKALNAGTSGAASGTTSGTATAAGAA